jgi:hypothetical protein
MKCTHIKFLGDGQTEKSVCLMGLIIFEKNENEEYENDGGNSKKI